MKKHFILSKIFLGITVVAVIISSGSLSLIPLISNDKSDIFKTKIIALLFWMGLFLVLLMTGIISVLLRRYRVQYIANQQMKKQILPGCIFFSINFTNAVIYAVIIMGLVLSITDIVWIYIPESVMFSVLSITMMFFLVHSVIDGKYYKVYKIMKEDIKYAATHSV